MHVSSHCLDVFRSFLAVVLLGTTSVAAQDAVSFHKQILPILEQRCQVCHQSENGQAGLSLAAYQDLLKGGRSGPAIVAGKPQESLLVSLISGAKPAMPRVGEPLSADQVDLMRRWIAAGAKDDTPDGPVSQQATWWSFRPLEQPAIPPVDSQWVRTPIDRFILSKLREKGLEPSPEADRRILIRRLTYNLHGLPPTPEDVEAFVNDPSPEAYENLVDRLIDSPRYGERWARHWLDVVHYGDSHGLDQDKPRRNAWPYRDYVIRSFNEDKPYAQFVREQLAGDVLDPDNPESIVATGFIAAGPWDFAAHSTLMEETSNRKVARVLDRDDMVSATMSTFTSVTAHCARCHDHKFDPIQQADYYSLQAVFAGVERVDRPFDANPGISRQRRTLREQQRLLAIEIRTILELARQQTSPEIAQVREEQDPLIDERGQLLNSMTLGDTPEGRAKNEAVAAQIKLVSQKLLAVNTRIEQLQLGLLDELVPQKLAGLRKQMEESKAKVKELPDPQWVYAVDDYFDPFISFVPPLTPRPIHLLDRGSVEAPGDLMQPGALSAIQALPARFETPDPEDEGARRLALAEWIVDRDNPLTWRSIVNRVWHYHFGRGIVETPNDFGKMGSMPTHPELLDWLAVEFRDSGQSIKKLHKLILLSAAYRQSSENNPRFAGIDGDNHFLWRMNRQRLEAEAVRDSVLYVAGNLDLTMGGPAAEQFVFIEDFSPRFDYANFDVNSPPSRRRSVYRFVVRSVPDPFMESLDCADPSALTPKRNVTLTAIQALALLNDPLVVRQAENLAARLRQWSSDPSEQIRRAYQLMLGRAPRENEVTLLASYARDNSLEKMCLLLLNSNEFVFVD